MSLSSHSRISRLLIPALIAFGSAGLQAQVEFTLTAAVTSGTGNNLGYAPAPTLGVFTFTTAANTTFNGDIFDGSTSSWADNGPLLLWSSVSGTGLTGSYSPPLGDGALSTDVDGFTLVFGDQNDAFSGISANGNQIALFFTGHIVFGDVPVWPHSGIASTPEAYFAPYVGTHFLSSSASIMMIGVDPNNSVAWTPLSMEIAVVPEPAAYAIALGGIVIVVSLMRRRRMSLNRD